MSIEEETAFLEQYRQPGEAGRILDVREIERAYTVCMNLFLSHLSKQYSDDIILLCCDGAAWHKSGTLCIPENIRLFFIPPYTPEMNPIEQIWKDLRKRGFRNEVFASLDKVVVRLCDTICSLTSSDIFNITARSWILSCFY